MTHRGTFQFDSIGSRFWLERLDGEPFTNDIKAKVTDYANMFDASYSRFNKDSLVARLARTGVLKQPPAELLEMLDYSRQTYDISEGAFNVTVGAVLHKLGYGARRHGGSVIADPWHVITWSKDKVVVPRGMMLDFGGFGKGWMIDAISAMLKANSIGRFVVNGGGDLYVQNDTPIDFALEDPLRPGYALRGVQIATGALAASNTTKRSWHDGDMKKHHIIDPATQDSSHTPVIASFVTANTALVADTIATIVIIRPDLKEKLKKQLDASILLVEQPVAT